MLTEENILFLKKKKSLIDYYYDNFIKFYKEKRYSKSAELLWGILNIYGSILGILFDKKIDNYNDLQTLIRNLSITYDKPELFEQFTAAKRLHANFYNDFMDDEMFEEDKGKILNLFDFLNSLYENEIQKMREK